MKLKCAYCKETFEVNREKPPSECPRCRRKILMPFHMRRNLGATEPTGHTMRFSREDIRKQRRPVASWLEHTFMMRRPLTITVVIALTVIIGVLIKGPPREVFLPLVNKTPPVVAQRELTVLRVALARFYQDFGRYPRDAEGLMVLINPLPGMKRWNGPYVTLLRLDPWGEPYRYGIDTHDVQGFILRSSGPDKLEDTDDDIYPARLTVEQMDLYVLDRSRHKVKVAVPPPGTVPETSPEAAGPDEPDEEPAPAAELPAPAATNAAPAVTPPPPATP